MTFSRSSILSITISLTLRLELYRTSLGAKRRFASPECHQSTCILGVSCGGCVSSSSTFSAEASPSSSFSNTGGGPRLQVVNCELHFRGFKSKSVSLICFSRELPRIFHSWSPSGWHPYDVSLRQSEQA